LRDLHQANEACEIQRESLRRQHNLTEMSPHDLTLSCTTAISKLSLSWILPSTDIWQPFRL